MAGSASSVARAKVYARDGWMCHYCRIEPASTLDHIVPKSAGGPRMQWNLVGACARCNVQKGNRRAVCDCFRCVEAERRFLGYSKPSNISRKRRAAAKVAAKARERIFTGSEVCPVNMNGQHTTAYSGMGNFCVKCDEILYRYA